MTHRRAVFVMIVVTLLWSTAGVITRHLEQARAFEVTFWRSLFNAAGLIVLVGWLRGPQALVQRVRTGGMVLWGSGLCWSVMFTAFMVAITMTTVANVLVVMATAPLFTALLSRFLLNHRLPARTWAAILVAGGGIAWMYGTDISGAGGSHVLGTAVAMGVPMAGAINWTLIQHASRGEASADMLPALLIGALISAAVTLPIAWPLQASGADIGWLALLGVTQLAIPCVMAVTAARTLSAPEVALLALLEVLFGVAWAWMGAGEEPSSAVLIGGALVLGALAGNELVALWRKPAAAVA
ncbi:DMT family transporter [Ideonella sp. DXS29W]|uniref:DMT family transporter n=1 Tax=Ideonella lacteola TaxID=2984193 RepID=A0ABU9BYM0_9BURK